MFTYILPYFWSQVIWHQHLPLSMIFAEVWSVFGKFDKRLKNFSCSLCQNLLLFLNIEFCKMFSLTFYLHANISFLTSYSHLGSLYSCWYLIPPVEFARVNFCWWWYLVVIVCLKHLISCTFLPWGILLLSKEFWVSSCFLLEYRLCFPLSSQVLLFWSQWCSNVFEKVMIGLTLF